MPMSVCGYKLALLEFGLLLSVCVLITDSQSTAVADSYAIVPSLATKIYDTSIVLVPQYPSVVFKEATFLNAANEFYSSAFSVGYISTINIVSNTTAQGTGIVSLSYNVVYNYTLLNTSVASNDQTIITTIGDPTAVAIGLEKDTTFNALYTVNTDPTTFSFAGNALCPVSSCRIGTYLDCVENQTGISVLCVSPCYNSYCYGDGVCFQNNSYVSPTCICNTGGSDVHYLGARCGISVLAVCFISVGIFLFILLIFIIIWLLFRRKKKRKQKEREAKEMEEYQNRAFAFENGVKVSSAASIIIPKHEEKLIAPKMVITENASNHNDDEDSSSESDTNSESSNESDLSSTSSGSSESIDSGVTDNQSFDGRVPTGIPPAYWLPSKAPPIKFTPKPKKVVVKKPPSEPKVTKPKKFNIEDRPGWIPSLGPNMYELRKSQDNLNAASSVVSESTFNGETDL